MCLPRLRNKAKEFDQSSCQGYATGLIRPSSIWARHHISGILILVHRKHRYKDIQMCRMFDVSTSRVFCRFGDRLTNRGLHFVGIRLRRNPVEIQVEQRLIDAIEILQVRESDKLVVAETVGLIRRQLCPGAGRHQRQARADSQQEQNWGEEKLPEVILAEARNATFSYSLLLDKSSMKMRRGWVRVQGARIVSRLSSLLWNPPE